MKKRDRDRCRSSVFHANALQTFTGSKWFKDVQSIPNGQICIAEWLGREQLQAFNLPAVQKRLAPHRSHGSTRTAARRNTKVMLQHAAAEPCWDGCTSSDLHRRTHSWSILHQLTQGLQPEKIETGEATAWASQVLCRC